MLAYVEFAVSAADLAEMLPFVAPDLSQWLLKVAPVLSHVSSHGGLRIYHESFRRFIVEHPITVSIEPHELLRPLIDWLTRRGFSADARAYRHLLRVLRRAGQNPEVLKTVDVNFLTLSLEAGHPADAILNNLCQALEAASDEQDWPAMTRLSELRRAHHTCFEEKLQDFELYGRAFAATRGLRVLSERLLFDGRPTHPCDAGLVLCSVCDDAGIVPPWSEYLSLKRRRGLSDTPDPANIAAFHGSLRLRGADAMSERVADWLARR